MKKYFALLLAVLILMASLLCGCSKDTTLNDYVVTNEGVVNIGVLLPLSSEDQALGEQILAGVQYANELAPGVNLDEKYIVNLCTYNINGDLDTAIEKLKADKVASVICLGSDKETTDTVISAFEDESTALVFTDCYSEKIAKSDNAFSISIPYSYQTSVASTYFISQGFVTGAVVYSGDDYSSDAAESFKSTFISAGGSSVSQYRYDCDDADFDPETIVGAGSEFVFIIGNSAESKELYLQLKEAGATMPIMISEAFDKTSLEDSQYNDLMYISKFEQDDNNYIGTDFLKTYSANNDVNMSDISADVAYGYDAYMMVYGALMGFNTGSIGLNSENETESSVSKIEVTASQVASALKEIVHMGVTDSIMFTSNGTVSTNFLYIGTIENSNAIMLSRYNYTNESN